MSSSRNPFSQFAAGTSGGGGGGGWMTAKRPGKDDAQIRRDRELALKYRKGLKQKNRKTPIMHEEEDDLDGFIVQDDEELDEISDDSSEEEIRIARPIKKNLKSVRTVIHHSSDDESDMENSTFLNSFKKRTSRPPPSLRNAPPSKLKKPNSKRPVIHLKSSSDDDTPVKPKIKARGMNKPPISLLSSDEDKPAKLKLENKFSEEKKDNASSDSELDQPAPKRKRFTKVTTSKQKKPRIRGDRNSVKTDKEKPKHIFYETSSEDESRPPSAPEASSILNGCDDDDEAIALAWALQESQEMNGKEDRKRLQKKETNSNKKVRRQVVVDLSADEESRVDSSEGEGEEEEQDAYENDDAREAGSVLNAANALGAKVLQTMTRWFQGESDNTIPTGIIVDGALSVFHCADNSSNHSWISHDLMRKVCPQVTLSDYQLIGVNWLALLHGLTCDVDGRKGGTNVNGVLADEMGLGKTVQTIAFLAWLRHHNLTTNGTKALEMQTTSNVINLASDDVEDDVKKDRGEDVTVNKSNKREYKRPHLILVPASVLSNWEREFNNFCPSMKVMKYHGTMAERIELREKMRQYLPENMNRATNAPLDVVLTTFSYFSCEKSDDRSFLRRFQFDYMVVDEAHCLKNPRGQRYRNLDKFVTSHRLLLTGTPVQNSPKELMTLLCFLMPLFSRTKTRNDGDYEEAGNDGGESMLQHFVSLEGAGETKDEANAVAYRKLKQLFAPFVLRRRKVDVLSQIMPPKTHKMEFVPFDDATRLAYDSILATHISNRENASVLGTPTPSRHLFTDLRKAANHTLLLRTRHCSEETLDHLATHLFEYKYFGSDETCTKKHVRKEVEDFSDFDIHCAALEMMEENPHRRDAMERYTLSEEDLFSSPKFVRLRALLPELVEKGHRILIFSQWTRCLDLLGCLLEALGMKNLRLDGQTAISDRQNLIDKFNQDCSIPVFLLSTRAGGMGINLTAADVCILHDLDFNPFNDIQAEDRCHRIGQTKPVTVIKMVTEGTVDADIYSMQERKAKMNAAILESSSRSKGAAAKNQSIDNDDSEISRMVESAMNRFLHSPSRQGVKIEAEAAI